MQAYETSTTVEAHGQIHVAGVPFAPGTEVEVTISPKVRDSEDQTLARVRERTRELFRTIQGFRNTPRIPREELYDRGSLR